MSFSPDELNPYSSPASQANDIHVGAPRSLPGFFKTVFIIDLVFCCLRLLLVSVGFVGAAVISPDDPLADTVVFELASGLGIVIFGIPGNIGLLMKKGWGVVLGYLLLVATLGSIATGVMQMMAQLDQFPEGSPERIGMMFGGGIVFLFRLGLMGLYLTALTKFSAWVKQD